MLLGSALFVIPGIGPLFAAGPLVAWSAGMWIWTIIGVLVVVLLVVLISKLSNK
jgi:hypothetical protein